MGYKEKLIENINGRINTLANNVSAEELHPRGVYRSGSEFLGNIRIFLPESGIARFYGAPVVEYDRQELHCRAINQYIIRPDEIAFRISRRSNLAGRIIVEESERKILSEIEIQDLDVLLEGRNIQGMRRIVEGIDTMELAARQLERITI